jgi:hypothetical protein
MVPCVIKKYFRTGAGAVGVNVRVSSAGSYVAEARARPRGPEELRCSYSDPAAVLRLYCWISAVGGRLTSPAKRNWKATALWASITSMAAQTPNPRNRANRHWRWRAYQACRARSLDRLARVASIVGALSERDAGPPATRRSCLRSTLTKELAGAAQAAVDGVFAPTRAMRTRWAKAQASLEPFNQNAYVLGDAVITVFQAALNIRRSEGLGSLLDFVRVETENDLLDEARDLLKANPNAAAAVIAGGALVVPPDSG